MAANGVNKFGVLAHFGAEGWIGESKVQQKTSFATQRSCRID